MDHAPKKELLLKLFLSHYFILVFDININMMLIINN